MFLRKWKAGKITVGLFITALLVLGGLNLTGLVKGEKAINEAEARLYIDITFAAKSRGIRGCHAGGRNCIEFDIYWLRAGKSITLSPGGIEVAPFVPPGVEVAAE